MAQFMMLLYDRPQDFSGMSPEEMQEIIGQYQAWGERLAEAGQLVSSEKLADGEGKLLSGQGSEMRILDGPYSETKEVVGGFYLIEAEDYDAAVKAAESSPHLGFGGTIEIRRIEEV